MIPSAVTVRPARPGDDAAIRRLLRESPLTGDIRLAMPREPDFFASTAVEGRRVQVAVAERDAGRAGLVGLIGMVLRAEKEMFVNGVPSPVGYLGGWRIGPTPEALAILRQGARWARGCHEVGRAPFYLFTYVEGDRKPLGLLGARRLGLPRPRDLGGLKTYLLRPASALKRLQSVCEVRRAVPADLPALIALLRQGSQRQFYPAYGPEDFSDRGLLRGLAVEDCFLAHRDGRLLGLLGLWDQGAYKQNRVAGYSPRLARLRPLVNAWNRLRGRPLLPMPGSEVRSLKLAAVCVPGDDQAIFSSLLHAALTAAARQPVSYVAAMVHERDPFAAVLDRLPAHVYRSRLGLAAYGEPPALDCRVPYVELGSL